ncbi:MAG TPA: hypothetical protein VN327_16520, partial [Pseudonocardiaceae bacterium]|nr:hypothetical protein [Pseudonocardiaceae bacterium]
DTDFDDDLRYFYQGEPFTGEAVETDPAGRVIGLITFRNGIAHGPDLEWYPDGTRRFEANVVNGNAVGISRQWHHNGQLAEETEFDERGEMVRFQHWNEDGSPAPVQQRALDLQGDQNTI